MSGPRGPVAPTPHRTSLPAPSVKNDSGLWSVLKTCVGKDLSKVTMPVGFNEPISFLQRVAESMEYAYLLQSLPPTSTPIDRLVAVGAFAVSALSSNLHRTGKPFNPLIGETYELQRDGYRMICEQVSHHPPISAFHASSPNFLFHGWVYPKLKLWGKSVEIHPKGRSRVVLQRMSTGDEVYTWKNISCTVHGVIVGKLWIEQHGTMEILCPHTGLSLNLHFKPAGWFNKELHTVEGFVLDAKKNKLRYVYGKWTDGLKSCELADYEEYMKANESKFRLGEGSASGGGSGESKKSPVVSPLPGKKMFAKFNSFSIGKSFSTSVDVGGSEGSTAELSPGEDEPPKSDGEIIDIPNSTLIWEANPRPENSSMYYHFTQFAMSLNEITEGMERLCPTDSRLRPDIKKMEEGELDKASEEKAVLEERQRKYLKGNEYRPLWFDKVGDDWVFNGKYWEEEDLSYAHLSKTHPNLPQLF